VNPPTIRVVHNNNVFLALYWCEKSGLSMFPGFPDGKGAASCDKLYIYRKMEPKVWNYPEWY
jgi:hypothetical protein